MGSARFAAAAMRRVFRRRAAASRAAGAVAIMSEDPDKRASCTPRFYTRKAAPHRPVLASLRRNARTRQASVNGSGPPSGGRKYRSCSAPSFASRVTDLLDSALVVAKCRAFVVWRARESKSDASASVIDLAEIVRVRYRRRLATSVSSPRRIREDRHHSDG